MLAATPNNAQGLGLLRLILTLVGENNGNIPASLKSRLETVIAQAKHLNADPTSIQQAVLPESIELALEMKVDQELADELESITNFDSIGSERATRILKEMENCSVC